MIDIGKKEIYIVGISTTTSNEVAHKDLSKLWNDFMSGSFKQLLGELESQNIFSVYSDYENGDKGKYKTTIGYAVRQVNKIPDGLSLVTIPCGKYKIYPCKSNSPDDVVAGWQTIWTTDPASLRRNFIADIEMYADNAVNIYIGHE